MIPYGRQWVDSSDVEAVTQALLGDKLTTGDWIERFEQALSTHTGGLPAAALNSGTAALHAAYAAAGLCPGATLVTSPLTFAATANAALYLGARVIFADVSADTGCLDPAAAEAAIAPAVSLIVPVDYAGHPADYPALRALAQRKNLLLGADACHSLGATQHGNPVGSLADFSCFSFHPVKPVTTAEGGAVVSRDTRIIQGVKTFRTHGIERNPAEIAREGGWYYAMNQLGFNYRLSDVHAALGWSQLRRLTAFTLRRREIARRYLEALADLPSIELPAVRAGTEPAWHLFVIRVREASRRRAFFARLQALRLGVQVHYIPVYWHPYYASLGYRRGACPVAEDFASRAVSIPIFPQLSDTELDQCIATIRQAVHETL